MRPFFFVLGVCWGLILCSPPIVWGILAPDWSQDFEDFDIGTLPLGAGINAWSENSSQGGTPCSSSNLQLHVHNGGALQGNRFLRFDYDIGGECYAELDFIINQLDIHTLEFYCRNSNLDHHLTVRIKQDDNFVYQYRVPYAPFLNTEESDWILVRLNLRDLWYSYIEQGKSGSGIIRIGLILGDDLGEENISGWFDIDAISAYTQNPRPYLNWAENRSEQTTNYTFNSTWGICTDIRARSPEPNGDFNPRLIGDDNNVISFGLLDEVEHLGFHWIRDNREWSNNEPSPGEFDFAWDSNFQDELESRELGRIFVVGYGHGGYYDLLGQNQYLPEGIPEVDIDWKKRFIGIVKEPYRKAFCNYATNLALNFKGKDNFYYEIWNEPNISAFWKPENGIDLDIRGRDYRHLASEAAEAIVEVQSDAKVFIGATSSYQPSFSKIVSDSLGSSVYGWSNHFYRWLPNLDWDESRNPSFLNHPEGMIGDVEQLRRIFSRQGLPGIPIICTEMGYNYKSIDPGPNNVFGIPDLSIEECDTLQARFAVRTQLTNAFINLPVMTYFALTGGSNNSYEEFSLISSSGKRPSYFALENLNRFIGEKSLISPIKMPYADTYGLLFKSSSVVTGVVWHSRRNATDTIILQRYNGLVVNDMWGNIIPIDPIEDDPSCFELVLSEERGPVFLSMPILASQIVLPKGRISLSSSRIELVPLLQDIQPFQPFKFYLVVDFSEVGDESQVSGWECSIHFPENVFLTSTQLEHMQLNLGDDNNFIATIGPTIPTNGLQTLAIFDAVIIDPLGLQNCSISIGPSVPSSFSCIEGYCPGWLSSDGVLFPFEPTWQENFLLLNPGPNSGQDSLAPYVNSARLRRSVVGEPGQVVGVIAFNELVDINNSSFSAYVTNSKEGIDILGTDLDGRWIKVFLSGDNIEYMPITISISLLEDFSGNITNNIELRLPNVGSLPEILITEVMQQPSVNSYTYLEVFNAGIIPVSLSGWDISCGIKTFEIWGNAWLNAGETATIVKNALPFPDGMTHSGSNVIAEIGELVFDGSTIELIDSMTGISTCTAHLPQPSLPGVSFETYRGMDPGNIESWHFGKNTCFTGDYGTPGIKNIEYVSGVNNDELFEGIKVAPNPLSTGTIFSFSRQNAGVLQVAIYDVRGGLVKSLISGFLPSGKTKIAWDGLDSRGKRVASGVYFISVSHDQKYMVKNILVVD